MPDNNQGSIQSQEPSAIAVADAFTCWNYGAQYEGADVGEFARVNGDIQASPTSLISSTVAVRAPFNLMLKHIVVFSNLGDITTEFGIYLDTDVTAEETFLYDGVTTKVNSAVSDISVTADQLVMVKQEAGLRAQFTTIQLYWIRR